MGTNYYDILENARKYREIHQRLQETGFCGNLREEIAQRMGMSVPNADRYGTFGRLIPLVQNMVRNCDVGMSSLLILAQHSHSEQQELYDILMEAWVDEVPLTRDFINCAVNCYRDGKRSWEAMKQDCSAFISAERNPKREWHRTFDAASLGEVEKLSGTDFELWFAQMLRKNQYTGVMTTQHSYDKGVDVVAQKDGVRYLFQCKNTACVGIGALQEIWFAKRDIDHVPVVVTRGTVAKAALRIAESRGILCWDGKVLSQLMNCESKADTRVQNTESALYAN